jgi:hypothetical protein
MNIIISFYFYKLDGDMNLRDKFCCYLNDIEYVPKINKTENEKNVQFKDDNINNKLNGDKNKRNVKTFKQGKIMNSFGNACGGIAIKRTKTMPTDNKCSYYIQSDHICDIHPITHQSSLTHDYFDLTSEESKYLNEVHDKWVNKISNWIDNKQEYPSKDDYLEA